MGDATISIQVHIDGNTTSRNFRMAADSSLADLMQEIQSSNLLNLSISTGGTSTNKLQKQTLSHLSIFDCSYHPPKDITSTVLEYDQVIGPKSLTLQALGLFPSGRLQICESTNEEAKKNIITSQIDWKEDVNYEFNKPDEGVSGQNRSLPKSTTNIATQGWSSSESMKPSQMLQSVVGRFQDDDKESSQALHSTTDTSIHKKLRKRKEEERCRRIAMRINELDKKKKKKKDNVSTQVKRMLIKSKSKGDAKLRQEDRFYLEAVVMVDTSDDKEGGEGANNTLSAEQSHRYFSRYSSFGKVMRTLSNCCDIASDKTMELLVPMRAVAVSKKYQVDDDYNSYGRLSSTMYLHEAEAAGYVSNFDRIVLRAFEKTDDKAYTKEVSTLLEELRENNDEA